MRVCELRAAHEIEAGVNIRTYRCGATSDANAAIPERWSELYRLRQQRRTASSEMHGEVVKSLAAVEFQPWL